MHDWKKEKSNFKMYLSLKSQNIVSIIAMHDNKVHTLTRIQTFYIINKKLKKKR